MNMGFRRAGERRRRLLQALLFGLLGVALAACGASEGTTTTGDARHGEIERLERRIAKNPGAAEAFRELGILHLRSQRPTQAYATLKDAYARNPSDPKTVFFLGLASEDVGKRRAARQLYGDFPRMPDTSAYRTLMMGRYEWLLRQEARQEIRERLARDDRLDQYPVSGRTVAVLPPTYQGDREDYAVLGWGLADLMTEALTRIRGLRPVEGAQVQALQAEMSLASASASSEPAASQVGRLLGAGHLLRGSYAVDAARDEAEAPSVRLNWSLHRIEDGEAPAIGPHTGPLQKLLHLHEAAVLDVAEALDISLSKHEQHSVSSLPTQNLEAFLAYSRGVRAEDRGQFEGAARHYRRAHRLDPSFSAAAQRRRRAKGLRMAAGPPERVLQTVAEGAGSQADGSDG